ncbi:Retrovirus-related Pol polyprotein from transposon RE1 [Vitis vinifera]|uniref:Retrovirus-related Pol polyprotein from transposon RE1 n=1 Tax=Vitis vinifera TaxID=29760 RepID=A0A438DAJ4_VITVI|nr:Retrovirus-related Pol polyprotein from transposon RE1 [Vitis vinifera]
MNIKCGESRLEGVPSFHSESAPTELSTPMPSSVQPAQHTNVPSPWTIQSPMPIQPIASQLANENLQVYIRRRKRQELEHGSQSACGQYIDFNSSLPEENIGEDRAGEVLIPNINDSTLPIALRKGVRRCSQHNTRGIKNFRMKKAVQDEIDALEKNEMWTITDLPVGKRLVGCKWIFTIKIQSRWISREIQGSFEVSCRENGHIDSPNVDDIILSGNDMEELQNLKKYLSEEFEVKDLGNLKYFLGMEVARSRKGIVVSQRKYILDLLKETGMLGCKPIDTPMDSQKKLGIEKESTPVDRGRYQRLVGRLIYLSHTRPDIGFGSECWKGLFFRKTENRDTKVYSDADWAGNIMTGGPLLDIVLLSGENLVTLGGGSSELGQTSSSPILMMCDNQAAISIAKNPVHHDRTKHVEIDRHFITEKVTSETVKLNYFLLSTKPQTSSPKLYLGLTSKT